MGVWVEFIFYTEEIVDEDGESKPLVPMGEICVTAPGMGKNLYGAVTQMEKDEHFHTYMARRVPQVIADVKDSVRSLRMKARPLMVPNYKDSAIKAKVLF